MRVHACMRASLRALTCGQLSSLMLARDLDSIITLQSNLLLLLCFFTIIFTHSKCPFTITFVAVTTIIQSKHRQMG